VQIVVRYIQAGENGQDIRRAFKYSLSREDIEQAVFSGPWKWTVDNGQRTMNLANNLLTVNCQLSTVPKSSQTAVPFADKHTRHGEIRRGQNLAREYR